MTLQKHGHKHAQTATHNWTKPGAHQANLPRQLSHCKRCGARRVTLPKGTGLAPDVSPFKYYLPDSPSSEYGKRPACIRKPAKVRARRWRPGDHRARGTRLLSKEEILRDSGVLPARVGVYPKDGEGESPDPV
jgi:hypothetical protein